MGEPEGTREGERAEAPAGETEAERGVGTFLYRMALAGVGALVLAQEELEGRLRKLRGREGQTEDPASGEGPTAEGAAAASAAAPGPAAEETAEESAEARKKKTLAGHIDATVSRVLHSLNVPTRGEVEELTRRLEELGRRLETLRR